MLGYTCYTNNTAIPACRNTGNVTHEKTRKVSACMHASTAGIRRLRILCRLFMVISHIANAIYRLSFVPSLIINFAVIHDMSRVD